MIKTISLRTVLIGMTIGGFMHFAAAQEGPLNTVTLNIAAQPVGDALNELARQTGLQVVLYSEVGDGVVSPAIVGAFTAEGALRKLLANSKLEFKFLDRRTVTIQGAGDEHGEPTAAVIGATDAGMRLTQAGASPGQEGASNAIEKQSPSPADRNSAADISEVIVTAQKRSERLQDVPVPVTAVSGDGLAERNESLLRDYYTRIPGLSLTPATLSNQTLAIRGITTGAGNPTVGVMVDDMPFGAATNLGGGRGVPDIDPGDLERIEVLRGPQGTLYGASSMGGLLKFVTRDPSTQGVSGRLQAGTNSVQNGDDLGYNLRGSVNLPLGDSMAIRASAFTRHDPGYIDDTASRVEGVNSADVEGGRVSALWKPSQALTIKLAALHQRTKGDGSSDDDIALGDLQQRRTQGTGRYDRKVQAYSATLTAELGRVDVTAVSGYNANPLSDSVDYAYVYGTAANTNFGVTGAELVHELEAKKFTQEIRFSVPLGRRWDWLLGGFYTDEDSRIVQDIEGINPTTGAYAGTLLHIDVPTAYREYAAFSNVTFNVSDRFDIQIGGRQSQIEQTFAATYTGPLATPSAALILTKDSSFTYLLTPRWRISPDIMIYARLASGYRAGGANAGIGVPRQYSPDKTQNYELGVKGDLIDNTLSVDASFYYIDWKDIQLTLANSANLSYSANTSRAKSQGLEVSVELKPMTGLTIAAWAAWSDAVLTEAFPPASTAYGASGDRLPNSSRFSGNVSLEQDFALWDHATGFVGGSVSYIGERVSTFRGLSLGLPLPRQGYPAYAKADLHAGVRYDRWTLSLFVNNLADKRGVLYGGLGASPPTAFTYIQPRTAGLSVSKTFQ